MAVGGNFWKWGRDEGDFVAEASEPFPVQLHGELRVERKVALLAVQFAPILRGERFGKVVGSEQDALSAGRKREHIDVLDDRAGQRFEIRDAFAAADFFELLVEIDVLIFVAREKHARGEAAAVFQLEKISAVNRERRGRHRRYRKRNPRRWSAARRLRSESACIRGGDSAWRRWRKGRLCGLRVWNPRKNRRTVPLVGEFRAVLISRFPVLEIFGAWLLLFADRNSASERRRRNRRRLRFAGRNRGSRGRRGARFSGGRDRCGAGRRSEIPCIFAGWRSAWCRREPAAGRGRIWRSRGRYSSEYRADAFLF